MATQSQQAGITQQDRTLSDLLEAYRHRQTDPDIPEERKQEAAHRMKPVWANLAKLQDPDGFVNHLSEYIQQEYHRRNAPEDSNLERRGKPLCRCSRSRHVCEVKQGEVPSKIRSQNLQYLETPDSRTLSREYVQEHSGDVVVREAMESYRGLRAEIYSTISDILAMMMGADSQPVQDSADSREDGAAAVDVDSPAEHPGGDDAPTAAANGGADVSGDTSPDLPGVDVEIDNGSLGE